MKFKAVIFDLDGTLLNTLQDLANAYNRMLENMKFPIHSLNAYRYFVGDGTRMCVARTLPAKNRDKHTIDKCLHTVRKDYSKNLNIFTRLYDGIYEMLNAVSDQGIKMAILSNKPQKDTEKCVMEYLSSWKFSAVLGQRDTIPIKPDPFSALAIASQFKILPEEFIFLGDTATDMKTATAAGMFPVGALWGFRTRKELKETGAKITVKNPTDILNFIK